MSLPYKPMTGLRLPKRIQFYKDDGTVYKVMSVPLDLDPDVYAQEMSRIEGHKYRYVVLED